MHEHALALLAHARFTKDYVLLQRNVRCCRKSPGRFTVETKRCSLAGTARGRFCCPRITPAQRQSVPVQRMRCREAKGKMGRATLTQVELTWIDLEGTPAKGRNDSDERYALRKLSIAKRSDGDTRYCSGGGAAARRLA
jgi:hypothetical protein